MNLPGARFAKSVEIREGKRLDEARIKALTGGDTISVRPLYRNAVSFKPTHKHWLAFNHKPVIADDSPAMWRRIRLIPFLATFERQEDDKELLGKLKAEASGILIWAIEGCLTWQKAGLEMPPAVARATADYQAESDHLDDFIEDCCIVEPGATVTSKALWQRYQQWTTETEEVQIPRNSFGERLEKRSIRRERSGHGGTRTWVGIGLIDSTWAQPPTDSLVHGDTVTQGDAVSRKSSVGAASE